ncbi:hypothetical protein LTR99_006099 [Exophiala xenobiotica]|uniref:Uncharacterized protein n=1 Tax=Vermiconidia calcicola TaxID=1690605 RepID=A0AAV9QF65_9PEZI|nr:hypothetical protein LTR92_006013 [Exophiala xenobiotica]KAK5540829.1 hypothetical protein LTR25_002606 [Vermiconidia calcicola]KAK5549681.1 hypothetical protein LTR23_000789 [Chaetothyriales sp. CCFEE 6169]KAK5208305.1 hypothetical protein LTR41_006241 [Exophiala xenobiotica]KAK5223084.1 hypothetical protein LTR72_005921 [Exophiala xenobiotica]
MAETKGSSKVPVVLVGGGTIAPLHAKYLLTSPTCQKLAESLRVAYFKSVAELVSSSGTKPDLYIVCVPSGLHVQVATEILNTAHPKAMLVEKPLSTDSSSGEELIALADARGCKIAVGHHRRFHPSITAAKRAILSGKLGKLTAISGVWTCKKNDGYFTLAQWRGSRAKGGGPVWTNFVHDADVLHYLVGAKVTQVWVTRSISRRTHPGVEEGDTVEEGAAMMLHFANGVVGTFLISDNVSSPYGWESATGDNPTYAPAVVPVDNYRVFGTEGTLTVPDGNLWTYRQEDADERGLEVGWNIPMRREVVEVQEAIPFQQQTEHLARLVAGTEEPVCSGRDGLAAVKVCEAVATALAKNDGQPVDIKQL